MNRSGGDRWDEGCVDDVGLLHATQLEVGTDDGWFCCWRTCGEGAGALGHRREEAIRLNTSLVPSAIVPNRTSRTNFSIG